MNTISNVGWLVIVGLLVLIGNLVFVTVLGIGWGLVSLWRRVTRRQT